MKTGRQIDERLGGGPEGVLHATQNVVIFQSFCVRARLLILKEDDQAGPSGH